MWTSFRHFSFSRKNFTIPRQVKCLQNLQTQNVSLAHGTVAWQADAKRQGEGLLTLSVRVKPGKSTTAIRQDSDSGGIVVELAAQARDGEANAELVREIAYTFQTPKDSVRIVAGHKSKDKTLSIRLGNGRVSSAEDAAQLVLRCCAAVPAP